MRKILFFIGGLVSGGKERRFIELLTYLKSIGGYEMLVVTTTSEVHFPSFFDLNIPLKNINAKGLIKTAGIPLELRNIARSFQPDVIHTWGRMQNFYTLPTKILDGIPLINSQITNASPYSSKKDQILDKINFRFSDLILSNSYAGIEAYQPPASKTRVIYNGMNLNRFKNLPDKSEVKAKYNIHTAFCVVMVATFSKNKDYEKFFNLASKVLESRQDISFVGVGYFHRDASLYQRCQNLIKNNPLMLMTGVINDVEALVNASDLGVLFSNKDVHGEGISNAVLEYMALGKAVIANDAGGTKEIIQNGQNGYLVDKENIDDLAQMVQNLIDNPIEREQLGNSGRQIVEQNFSIKKMGDNFSRLYDDFWNTHLQKRNSP
jgi:glycosyltransferase involved in cell wall biosynthesis